MREEGEAAKDETTSGVGRTVREAVDVAVRPWASVTVTVTE
jgi:hypothetical protein